MMAATIMHGWGFDRRENNNAELEISWCGQKFRMEVIKTAPFMEVSKVPMSELNKAYLDYRDRIEALRSNDCDFGEDQLTKSVMSKSVQKTDDGVDGVRRRRSVVLFLNRQ